MRSKQFKEIAKYAMLRGGILAAMAVITFLYPNFLTGGMVYIDSFVHRGIVDTSA